jgi:hypothetical protein
LPKGWKLAEDMDRDDEDNEILEISKDKMIDKKAEQSTLSTLSCSRWECIWRHHEEKT